jgi:hypothetical protein
MAKVLQYLLPLTSMILFMSSCVSPPEPYEDEPRLPSSRTLSRPEPRPQQDPWIQAQRLMERGEARPSLVGAHALKNWMKGRNLHIWNLCSERARATYPNIYGAKPIDSLQQAKKASRKMKGTLVLVADESQEAFQKSVWKELNQHSSLRVYLLAGGIEGWIRTFPPKP